MKGICGNDRGIRRGEGSRAWRGGPSWSPAGRGLRLSLPTTPLPPGTPGNALLQLRFLSSREDAEAMERALQDCERIEPEDE